MRSKRAASAAAAAAALAVGVALTACSGASPSHQARASSSASRLPSVVAMRGTLNATSASSVYSAAIVPAYPLAVKLADTIALHPAGAAPAVSSFASRLSAALASFRAVTGFPSRAQPSFAAYRSVADAMLATLGRPSAVLATEATRRQAALQLYAFAHQIGVLGSDLNLVPATEPGDAH
jgi:hypothetical protein